MAPELWKGEKPSAASDVYALGVVLRELAGNQRTPRDPWDSVVRTCLDPAPEKRFLDASEVAVALEPSRAWKWWLAAAAAVALAAGVGAITYEGATAPQESIRLALLPLEAGPGASAQAARVSQDASREMARVKGGKRVRLAFVPLADVIRRRVDSASQAQSGLGATHVVRGRLTALDNGRFVLHAFVTDTRTQANNGDWEFGYAPGELRYAPLALAGMVTATLRLPPLAVPGVNTAAREDYLAGLAYAGRNSTVDKALPLFESAVAADPDSAFTWAALAEAQWMKYFITKDEAWLGRTTESLRHAQSRDLDLAPVHRVTGLLRFNSGFYELAEAEYQRSIELDPANGATYWRLGQAFENNNQLDQALGALRKAVDLEPNNFKMYLELGAFHLKRGDLTEAVRLFETCVRLAPDEPEAHYALGTAYSDQGRWAEAERELRKAIAPGGTASALNNLANVLITQGKDGEVIPFLLSALKQFPDRYRWWMNLGDAYRRTDQPKDSKSAYRRALELAGTEMARNPRDGAVRSGLAYLSARLDDRKRAESEIAQALQSSPGDKDTQLMAAWTYEALGERAQTLTLLANVQDEILAEAARLPNLAELRKDSRFQELLSSHRIQ
jgi:tetratricopeptide (TPR) repeat protein